MDDRGLAYQDDAYLYVDGDGGGGGEGKEGGRRRRMPRSLSTNGVASE